jgi:hypothetical protein
MQQFLLWNDRASDTLFGTNASERMRITSDGKVGIGTPSPRGAIPGWPSLDLGNGGLFFGSYNVGGVSFASTSTWPANGGLIAWNKINYAGETSLINFSGGGNDGGFSFWDRDTFLMRITKAGNVGIGTMSPGNYKLAVEGILGAREVVVTTSPWADYVFRPGYRLQSLNEVSAYIQANGHLPEIPTEAEVKEKGISVGEMQAKLLAKIEELTLHMIELEAKNECLEHEIRELRGGNHGKGKGKLDDLRVNDQCDGSSESCLAPDAQKGGDQ